MSAADAVGSIGVSLLLLAFFLGLFGFLEATSRRYALLNVLGSGLACYASALIPYWPFVVLEGTWCLCALVAAVRGPQRNAAPGTRGNSQPSQPL